MRVLVTGHKGFIGTIMVPMLQSEGFDVVGLDCDLYRNSTYGDPPAAVPELTKDVRDVDVEDIKGLDAIIHLAGLSNDMLGDLNPELTYDINHLASVRLAEMARDVGVSRFLFASSCSNYGAAGNEALDEKAEFNPVTPYAISKVRVEADVSQMATDTFSPVFLRNATAYGVSPRIRFDVVLNNLTAWAYTTGNVRMKSDGSPWRPLVHIEDISRACIAALLAPQDVIHNQAFNVGRSSENYQIRDLANIVKETVPDCEVTFAEGAGIDKRNYRVSFAKYERLLKDYPLKWDATQGVKDVYESYKRIGLKKDEYEGPKYKRIAQLRLLLESGLLGDDLRWRV